MEFCLCFLVALDGFMLLKFEFVRLMSLCLLVCYSEANSFFCFVGLMSCCNLEMSAILFCRR